MIENVAKNTFFYDFLTPNNFLGFGYLFAQLHVKERSKYYRNMLHLSHFEVFVEVNFHF
jgi:hypothetical protein